MNCSLFNVTNKRLCETDNLSKNSSADIINIKIPNTDIPPKVNVPDERVNFQFSRYTWVKAHN